MGSPVPVQACEQSREGNGDRVSPDIWFCGESLMNALIFDCDGVLADTERYGHLPAFNQTFQKFGLPVQWSEEEYGVKLKIAGGKERMASLLTPEFVQQAGLPSDPEAQKKMIADWHKYKTAAYK